MGIVRNRKVFRGHHGGVLWQFLEDTVSGSVFGESLDGIWDVSEESAECIWGVFGWYLGVCLGAFRR